MNQPQRQNPFVGLRPFESEDSLYYFGRDEQTKALLQHLHRCRFLAVVGSSGCGKSSLVRAGLIPHLQAGFLVQDRDAWLIAAMKPGDGPLYNLAAALLGMPGAACHKPYGCSPDEAQRNPGFAASSGDGDSPGLENRVGSDPAGALREALRDGGSSAILNVLRPILEGSDDNLLLLVDQFEELFRFGLDAKRPERREEATDFVAMLLALAQQRDLPVYVCITMRSDFFGECDGFYGLPEAMNRGQYLASRLTRKQRREAIVGPVNLAGGQMAPRLVDRLLNENIETRDDLPVLQHALMRTWTKWEEDDALGPIDMVHYEATGTVMHALDGHAEAALKALSAADQPIAKILFQTLTETDQGNRTVRRPTLLEDIAEIAGVPPDTVLTVIEKFRADERNFLVLSADIQSANPLVDISHESLIRQWKTLVDWVGEETESAKQYQRLVESAALHQRGKARLYSDPDLQLALDWRTKMLESRSLESVAVWAKRHPGDFPTAMSFLDASQQADRQAKDKELEQQRDKERLLREKAEAVQREAEQQQRALRRSRMYNIIIGVFLLVAIGTAGFAVYQGHQAKIQTQIAKSQKDLAQEQKQSAEYNLAKVFESKALQLLLDKDKNHPDNEWMQNGYMQTVWLYIAAALQRFQYLFVT